MSALRAGAVSDGTRSSPPAKWGLGSGNCFRQNGALMLHWHAVVSLLLLCGFGAVPSAHAAETNGVLPVLEEESPAFTIKTFRMSDGLPSERLQDIIQTRDGYLWITTFNGLARFDGVRFRVFHKGDTPELRNSQVHGLFEDESGRLWIGSDTGEITWHDATGFHAVTTPDRWPPAPVEQFVESRRDTILALNRRGVICVISNGVSVQTLGSPAGIGYSELAMDRDHQVWAARRGTGGRVVRIENGAELTNAAVPPVQPGFLNIAPARSGGIWVRNGSVVKRWEKGAFVEDRKLQPWHTPIAVKMRETLSAGLLVGTFDEGVFLIPEAGETVHLNRENGLPDNWVTGLLEDSERTLWLATGAGLTQLRPPVLKVLCSSDRWQGRAVGTVWPDPDGGLWVGTLGAGVYFYDGKRFRRYWDTEAGPTQDIRAILKDRGGRLWVGTQGGLRYLDGDRFVDANATVQMPALVYALHEARDGTLWVGTDSGVALRDAEGRWSRTGQDLERPDVRAIAETPNGDFWLGLRGGGLARYAGGKFTQFRTRDGLPYNNVWSLLADANGDLWIGTPGGGGLTRGRAGSFVNFTTANGLPSNFICSLQDDGAGNLWVASYGGVFRVAKAELDRCARGEMKTVNVFVLGPSDGLASLDMSGGNQPSSCRLGDGRLAFPTGDGLAVVNPGAIRLTHEPPRVRIEAAWVDRQPMPGLTSGSATGTAPTAPLQLVVPPGKTQIEIHYTAFSFSAPERIRFKVRLLGMDHDWVEMGERRAMYYSHVPPGQYEFQVIAADHHGIWNEEGATLQLTVQPFFWQTWWFAPLCWLGGTAGLGAAIMTVFRRRHHQRVQALERARLVERERRRIAQDLHDDLGAGLTEIDSTSALAQETVTDSEAKTYFQEIRARSRGLITSMDEIVWAVNPRNDNLSAVTTYFCHYAEQFLRSAPMSCRFDIPGHMPPLPLTAEQRHSLFLAYKEALNNAVKHSAGSEVSTEFALKGDQLHITVADNGRGLPENVETVQADGLHNMRDRLEQLGGRCEIGRSLSGGVRVTFQLPIRETSI